MHWQPLYLRQWTLEHRTCLGNITGTATPTVARFFSSVLASTYIDWLSGYNTGSPSQHIGRGTFSQKVTITPSSTRNGSTLADTSIQAEINAQIGAGKLPAPGEHVPTAPIVGEDLLATARSLDADLARPDAEVALLARCRLEKRRTISSLVGDRCTAPWLSCAETTLFLLNESAIQPLCTETRARLTRGES